MRLATRGSWVATKRVAPTHGHAKQNPNNADDQRLREEDEEDLSLAEADGRQETHLPPSVKGWMASCSIELKGALLHLD